MLPCVMIYCVIFCYVTLYFVVLCYVMLRYIVRRCLYIVMSPWKVKNCERGN